MKSAPGEVEVGPQGLRSRRRAGLTVLMACIVLSCVMGTVHAFSVFLEPLEVRFAIGRDLASLTYSLALVALTLGVLVGHRIYGRFSPPVLTLVLCLGAAGGLLLAAFAREIAVVWLGYSGIFGFANGLGYGFALQFAAQANARRGGMAMGLVTAVYALGAALAPLPLWEALRAGGLTAGLVTMAAVVACAAPLGAFLFWRAGLTFQQEPRSGQGRAASDRGALALLWVGYGAGVAAGLAAIGHATGIARAGGATDIALRVAPIAIAVANMTGGLLGGWLCDRLAPRRLLIALPILSALALGLLASGLQAGALVAGLAAVGFAYGAIIAVYPAAIAQRFGALAGVRIYGRVFTAWGTAGLLAPWAAGLLFDLSSSYRPALICAALLALLSALAAIKMPPGSGVISDR